MFRLFFVIAFLCLPLAAQAQESTMMTVLRPVHAQVQEDRVVAMLQGFAACDPVAALPKEVLAPLGVRYLTPRQVFDLRLQESVRLKDRSVFVLRDNDPVNTERDDVGRYRLYGARYRLRKGLHLGPSINLRGVGEMVGAISSRPRVGMTYVFDAPAEVVVDKLDRMYGLNIRGRLDNMPDERTASIRDVWFTLGQDGKTLSCWRVAD